MFIWGKFDDQRGYVKKGKLTGHKGTGAPVHKYTWIKCADPKYDGKSFEADSEQIELAEISATLLFGKHKALRDRTLDKCRETNGKK